MRLTLLLLLISTFSNGQDIIEKTVNTDIREVTVFLESAQIKQKGTVSIQKGKSKLVLKKLSPHMDEKSIQVKAIGDFTILSVNSKVNFLDELAKTNRIDSIENAIDLIDSEIKKANSRIEVLNEKQSLLNENKKLTGENSSLSLTQLRDAINFFEKEITSIKKEELQLLKSISDKKEQLAKLQKEKASGAASQNKSTSEITVQVDANSTGEAALEISYLVKNAGWFPKYDIRAESIEKPLRIDYKASVYQNTGNDWKDVKLKFSNGNPNEGGTAPQLSTWFLNYARLTSFRSTQSVATPGFITGRAVDAESGEPLSGLTVTLKGTTVGTVTDFNGRYSIARPSGNPTLVFSFVGYSSQEISAGNQSVIDIRMSPSIGQLEEVLAERVSGVSVSKKKTRNNLALRGVSSFEPEANILETEFVENQTTVEIEVTDPYTLKSNGEQIQVDLKKYQIEASFEYYAVPKLDKDVFLMAKITNWDQYNFLAGEANLYFEDAYVGRSILDAKSLKDTLEISLGRDKSIVINREKKDELSKRRSIGANTTESRTYNIEIRNQKSSSILLTLLDQLPKPINSNISVAAKELSGGTYSEQTGEVKWEMQLGPQSKKELTFGYEVKYPKRERVILD